MFGTPEGDIACRTCYQKHFFTGGKSAFLDYTKLGESSGAGPSCPACKGEVFQAESVAVGKRSYHRRCLACISCRRALDPSSYYEGGEGMVYCRGCYTAEFGDMAPGPQEAMVHFPASPGDLSCEGCGGKLFQAEKLVTSLGVFHRQCYKCTDCSCLLHTTRAHRCFPAVHRVH